MATKKTKEEAAPATAAAPATDKMAAARAARNGQSENDVFTYVKDADKGAPQLKAIVTIVKAAGKDGISRKDLTAKMVGVVVTRQPQGRILSYYQKDMVSAGYLTLTKAAAPATAAA